MASKEIIAGLGPPKWIKYYDSTGKFEGEISYPLEPPQDGEIQVINGNSYYYDAITVRFKQFKQVPSSNRK